MTAAHHHAAAPAAQPALLPELTPPALPDQPARFAVMGLLQQDARHYTDTAGNAHVQVLITQRVAKHPQARPVLATYRMGASASPGAQQAAAAAMAARMRAGAEVVVLGSWLEPALHQGKPVLQLGHVAGLRLQDSTEGATQ